MSDIYLSDDDYTPAIDDQPATFAENGLQNTRTGFETVDIEKEPLEEVSAVLQGFKNRAAREEQRILDAVDSEYWVAICFQTREQKEEFLKKTGLYEYGDKYLDGMMVAHELGVQLTARVPDMPKARKDTEWSDMALDFTES